VRGIPNPYNFQHPPYAKFTLFSESKPCWFGVGIGTVGKPTQERLNKIINQRLDNVDLVLNKQGFYNGNDPLINVKKLQVSAPGTWRKVSDTVSSVRWMDTPDVTASAYRKKNWLRLIIVKPPEPQLHSCLRKRTNLKQQPE